MQQSERGCRCLPKLNSNVCVVGLEYSKLQPVWTPAWIAFQCLHGFNVSWRLTGPRPRCVRWTAVGVSPSRQSASALTVITCRGFPRALVVARNSWETMGHEAVKLCGPVNLQATGVTWHLHAATAHQICAMFVLFSKSVQKPPHALLFCSDPLINHWGN